MLCDGRPDPTSKKELNTYMNLWKDETEFKEVKVVLGECELTLEVSFVTLRTFYWGKAALLSGGLCLISFQYF